MEGKYVFLVKYVIKHPKISFFLLEILGCYIFLLYLRDVMCDCYNSLCGDHCRRHVYKRHVP